MANPSEWKPTALAIAQEVGRLGARVDTHDAELARLRTENATLLAALDTFRAADLARRQAAARDFLATHHPDPLRALLRVLPPFLIAKIPPDLEALTRTVYETLAESPHLAPQEAARALLAERGLSPEILKSWIESFPLAL